MDQILDLWLPIVLSSVFILIASSIIWMVLPYHKEDIRLALAGDANGRQSRRGRRWIADALRVRRMVQPIGMKRYVTVSNWSSMLTAYDLSLCFDFG